MIVLFVYFEDHGVIPETWIPVAAFLSIYGLCADPSLVLIISVRRHHGQNLRILVHGRRLHMIVDLFNAHQIVQVEILF